LAENAISPAGMKKEIIALAIDCKETMISWEDVVKDVVHACSSSCAGLQTGDNALSSVLGRPIFKMGDGIGPHNFYLARGPDGDAVETMGEAIFYKIGNHFDGDFY
jgi:hypothetical protein